MFYPPTNAQTRHRRATRGRRATSTAAIDRDANVFATRHAFAPHSIRESRTNAHFHA
jgi:hypothetical protein